MSQIAEALRARGFEVIANAGQSVFRCDLAIRRPEADALATAILVDHSRRLAGQPLDERRVTQPAALESAGWRVVQVLATEWESEPQQVVERIILSL